MKSAKNVRESLIKQLRAKGADLDHFIALVDDYVFYHSEMRKANADDPKRGSTYTAMSAAGKKYEKDNPNCKLITTYTRAMLSILKELNLTTESEIDEDEDVL